MRYLVVLLSLALTTELFAQAPPREPLADRVKKSIDRGVEYLKRRQRPNEGSWPVGVAEHSMEQGATALAVLALLNCGVPANDDHIKKGLKYLREHTPNRTFETYTRALMLMAFVEAGLPEDKQRVKNELQWLLDARVVEDGKLLGWKYTTKGDEKLLGRADNSNTQYAVLALWAAKQADLDIPRDIWESVRQLYARTQNPDGSWVYVPGLSIALRGNAASLTMTTAGISGLLIAGMELNDGREEFLPNGQVRGCGVYSEQSGVIKGMDWLTSHFNFEALDAVDATPKRTFYHIYGIERTGRLTGQRFFGPYDWYREGSKYLVKLQKTDGIHAGAWYLDGTYDQWPTISTSFALLFLSKGRTPVLVSKLVHGDFPRRDNDTDWNNDRNDLRNLVSFASKNLFNHRPVAWQSFDIMRALPGNYNEDDLQEVTAELLQTPIVYITGHKAPRFTEAEKNILKRYVDNGGFIFAEACCSSPDFDRGFKALVDQLWRDNGELTDLPREHPIWTAFHTVEPGQPYRLMGLTGNCKTILVYAPVDVSCKWESNRLSDGVVRKAFELGNNLIVYVTGKELPRPRLTAVSIAGNAVDPPRIPRGTFRIAQIKIPGELRPAPRAMSNLLSAIHREDGLDVVLKTEDRHLNDKNIIDYKLLYMHGRGEFLFDPSDLKHLRFNLENGGMLLADACCGQDNFDKSFRNFAKELFPDRPLERVPVNDFLFGAKLNHVPLDSTTIRCRRETGGDMLPAEPYLEGIRIDGRWVVLYSKYDLGCALEGHKASSCRGYDQASAERLGRAAVLYLFWSWDRK